MSETIDSTSTTNADALPLTAPAGDGASRRTTRLRSLRPRPDDLIALGGGGVAVFLMIFWAVDDGGFDPGTWYWGALAALACLAAVLVITRDAIAVLPRALKLALVLFALYVAWSYLSMTWAAYAGLALQGSNRALLYLIVFTLMAVLPWRRATASIVLGAFALGVGTIAIALLVRLSLGDHISSLFLVDRLVATTGYINSTAALFTIGALVAVAIAARRDVPGLVRGLMLGLACADLLLAVMAQSRGWLFTLPIVGVWCALFAGERLRGVAAAILPAAGALVVIHPALRLYELTAPAQLTHAAEHAGKLGLLSAAGVFFVATLAAWIESALNRPPLRRGPRAVVGTGAVVLVLAGLGGGLVAVSGGHPGSFVSKQLRGFAHDPTTLNTSESHFLTVGSGRVDFWRVAIDAAKAHPVGGLGQDNFGDYYLTHRHTNEEPLWPHSLELRLLASTGIVGFVLFFAFLAAALVAAVAARRRGASVDRMLVGAALLPLGVWLIHGSIDWFWEVPALSGPSLGFLAMAGRLRLSDEPAAELADDAADDRGRAPAAGAPRRLVPRPAAIALAVPALVAATIVLGLPYLAVRELNLGVAASHTNPSASLADFRSSHKLNPLMSDPGTLGGTVALENGQPLAAASWFRQALAREPGQWFDWLGAGLSQSALGNVDQARGDFRVAVRLNDRQLPVRNAIRLVGTRHPLTIGQALDQINYLP